MTSKYKYSFRLSTIGLDSRSWVNMLIYLQTVLKLNPADLNSLWSELEKTGESTRSYNNIIHPAQIYTLSNSYGLHIINQGKVCDETLEEQVMVFVVRKNSDRTEGRGSMLVDSVFTNRPEAEKYMKEQPGIMGFRSGWDIKEMPLFSFAEQRQTANLNEQKVRALAKLSQAERNLLGLGE